MRPRGARREEQEEGRTLNISMTTRIESETVVARLAISLVNMLQPIDGNDSAHEWKCVCGRGREGQWRDFRWEEARAPMRGTHELVPRDLRAALVEHEPPGVCREGEEERGGSAEAVGRPRRSRRRPRARRHPVSRLEGGKEHAQPKTVAAPT